MFMWIKYYEQLKNKSAFWPKHLCQYLLVDMFQISMNLGKVGALNVQKWLRVWKCERSEILLCFQANKLVCHRLIDAGRKHETLRSETEDFITHNGTKWIIFVSPLAPYASQFPQGNTGWFRQCVCISLRNPKIRKPQSFIISHKQTCLTFVTKGDIIFIMLENKQIHLLLYRKIVLNFQ